MQNIPQKLYCGLFRLYHTFKRINVSHLTIFFCDANIAQGTTLNLYSISFFLLIV